jgi:putative selenate reductase
MSDKFYQISIEKLFSWMLKEEAQGKIFGMYTQNLYAPKASDPFRMHRYGRLLETPLGVAAGPQTQLAQNIIGAWLCGARYIELKTVQTLDEIHVSKPCIEVEDEGYNCEWSQELTLKGSFEEYLNAWIVMHALKHKFGWEGDEQGFIFNMSVGYDYAGILKPNVQWFLKKMENCEAELAVKIEAIAPLYPAIRDIKIPSRMTDNITLSTMHGCPPNEIHKIGKYLIEERKLHTTIKLNPTLLGPEHLRKILNTVSGFTVNVPDIAFEHDLKYPDALELIKSLQQSAEKSGVTFNLKLTNTLESLNLTRNLPENEKMVYASGRALHPISINLAAKLQNDFDGKLDISFCAGVDAFNVADTLACGLKPITVCSDLLKPGGYMRMTQYVESLEKAFAGVGAQSIDEFVVKTNGKISDVNAAALDNLNAYAGEVLKNKAYHKSSFPHKNIKTKRTLTEYDCVHAPCIEACAVDQNVPNYMYYTGLGDFENAYKVITTDNPIPNITGNVCDHLCQTKCTRMNYDDSLQIRAIKRFNAEEFNKNRHESTAKKNGIKVGIIGAGPAGLSCAYFLALEGFTVDVYESKPFAGGMPSDSIPEFRLSADRINADVELVKSVGANLHFNHKVDAAFFEQLKKDCSYIFIGIGAQKSKKLEIPGEDAEGVFDQLQFLSIIRRGGKIELGAKVAVIGGGNSAIDTARTANRIIGNGRVQVVYRRTVNEMPADKEEVDALLKEGIEIIELTAPLLIEKKNGKLRLTNIRMELSEKDASGRRRPVPVKGSEFVLEFDNILTAIGQDIDLDFILPKEFSVNKGTLDTNIPNVFMGGDAVRGADSLINAVGDGKRAALKIAGLALDNYTFAGTHKDKSIDLAGLQKKVAHREPGLEIHESPKSTGKNFELVHATITKEEAVKEAQRCLLCDDVCNICTTVCPNFANVAYDVVPMDIPTYKVVMNMGKAEIIDNGILKISQKPQIINVRDFCNECGNCDSFCPTAGAPYKTKPKFHLTKESFDAEEAGFHFENGKLLCKKPGFISSLAFDNGLAVYESPAVTARFGKDDFELKDYTIKNGVSDAINLEHISEMFLLLKTLKDFPLFQ